MKAPENKGNDAATKERAAIYAAKKLADKGAEGVIALLGQDREGFELLVKLHQTMGEALWTLAGNMSPIGDSALNEALNSTVESVRRVHKAKQVRVKLLTSKMREFPMLISPRLEDRDKILEPLIKLGVGRDLHNLQPKARWKRDEFSEAAEAIIAGMERQGFDAAGLARRGWDTFRKHLRSGVISDFMEDPTNKQIASALRAKITGRKGTKAIMDRVSERIIDRINSILGLKGREGIGAAP